MAKPKPMPSQTALKELLDYDPETGIFRWRQRSGLAGKAAGWNTKWAGKVAGKRSSYGHILIKIFGLVYSAHRLAWVYMNGSEPPEEIDHLDGIPSNNRIDNLRTASREMNCQNIALKRNNTSGFRGVSFIQSHQKWGAYANRKLQGRKENVFLGLFDTPEKADHVIHEWRMKNFPGYTGRGRQVRDQ